MQRFNLSNKNLNWPLILFILFFLGPLISKALFSLIILIILGGLFYYIKNNNKFNLNNFFGSQPKVVEVNNMNNNFDPILNRAKHKAGMIISIVLIVWLLISSIKIVDAGNTGIYQLFGRVGDKELSSGLHLIIPLAEIIPMTIRTQEYTMSISQGEGKKYDADPITSLTKEGLQVDLDMTVLYHLNEEQASDVYKNVGLDYEEKIIRPGIRSSIREVIAQYEAKDIYSDKREEAAKKIKDKLSSQLNPRGIVLEDVLLRNVQLPSGLAESIQQKLQAEQEAQRYEFLLQKETKEKERKIIEAEGQRESQKIVNESLTPNYLNYLYITSLKDREGTIYVPTSPTSGMPLFREAVK